LTFLNALPVRARVGSGTITAIYYYYYYYLNRERKHVYSAVTFQYILHPDHFHVLCCELLHYASDFL